MEHVQKAGGIVLNKTRDMVLTVVNDLGKTTLPKGSMKPGESHVQTAIREVLEEGGLKNVVLIKELGTIVRPGFTDENTAFPSVIKHIRMYLFTTEEEVLDPHVEDIESASWSKFDDVTSVLSWPEEAQFFEEQRKRLSL